MENTQKKSDHAKYDRQLRLWGEEGQAYLEDARLCLINATATGTETLKNLVLPGIGSFTIVDGNKVHESDFNNFFIVEGSIGKSRAAVAKEALNELNDLVQGDYLERDPIELINTEPDYFKRFTVVVANDLPEEPLLKLAKVCWDNRIVLIVTRVYGFLGYIRVAVPEHTIIESKPDNPADDLRLANPFPELEAYANSIDMSKLNSTDFSHTPFIVILLQAVKKWKEQHDGKLPQTSQERNAFKMGVISGSTNANQANFDEAYKAYFKAITATRISESTQSVLADSRAANVDPTSTKFWIMAAALKGFVQGEGNGFLPLMGSIPDMTATTTGYIAIQRIYQEKAAKDVQAVFDRVQNILKSVGKSGDFISAEEVKKFCKNAQFIQSIRYRSLEEERAAATAKSSDIASKVGDDESNVAWYVMFRAVDRFFTQHKRYPGWEDSQVQGDVEILRQTVNQILTEIGVSANVDDKYVQEMVRYGAAELHTLASFIGGVASQEAIKLITHQYVPMDNTFIYNGLNSTTVTASF
eukprot:TRINITY_DN2138_c0_g1_i2.p1 TRINITY_DN2138_c0_g1~~TRINITY_DN2138_c0_g1_i2.p1  ORF type:complete len:556 (-),score=166.03 TRINITY_DN2138_c0_g1_i2:41-1624(-)